MKESLPCPHCGGEIVQYRNPFPTVDIVIEIPGPDGVRRIVLIERRNPPHGWALPGGFVDYGESVEQAAAREAAEETGLKVDIIGLLGVYSRPDRDPRFHTLTTVFVARAFGEPLPGDDAGAARLFSLEDIPQPLCFDHAHILEHYRQWTRGLRPLAPAQPYLLSPLPDRRECHGI